MAASEQPEDPPVPVEATRQAPPLWRRPGPVAAALVALWLAVTAVLLVQAWKSASAAEDELEAIRTWATPASLLSGQETDRLRGAEASARRARAKLRSLPVSPLRALPVLGRQFRSADSLALAAAEVADAGADALEEATALVGDDRVTRDRPRLLAGMAGIAERTAQRVDGIELGPADALVGPVARARADAAKTVDELTAGLERARLASDGLARLLDGGAQYLLLVANNAEMRAGSGMFLTAGVATFAGGSVDVSELEATSDLLLSQPVEVEADIAERWGWLAPGREWRNLGVSPRFEVTAAQAARMWEAARGEQVEGVLAVDVAALRAVLAAAGPIDVAGQRLDAGNIEQDLFRDQYAGSIEENYQSERQERLGMVAQQALGQLDRPDLDVALLAGELVGAARGRHLLAWSPAASMQRAWEAAGVAGTVEEDDLLLAVLNRGGNKLDQFLDVAAKISLGGARSGQEVVIDIELTNRTPADAAPYILGPDPSLAVEPGTYVGLVSATLPGPAGGGRFDGIDELAVAGADGSNRVVAAPVTVAPGTSSTLTLRFDLPRDWPGVNVLPGARIPPIAWSFADLEWFGDHAEWLEW
ncbi:MAG TPA: DUF4012 domain-containing protein [Acidimicrobiales bacterium]|nr:DUF4012 domain-containing protein [Acidimicrobiales bacterium]